VRGRADAPVVDALVLRLIVLGAVVALAFVILFARLWMLQISSSDDFRLLAQENRVRLVHSEPARGRILDRKGNVLVANRSSRSVTLDRTLVEDGMKKRLLLRRLGALLRTDIDELKERLNDPTVSPYKPIVVANDVPVEVAFHIRENPEDFPGVQIEKLPVRYYPHGRVAAQVLGYVGEISPEQLMLDYFASARPGYEAGDIVGKMGLERSYDRLIRGRAAVERVTVNASGKVVGTELAHPERPGRDLVTSLDLRIQKLTERALGAGIAAARKSDYEAPSGGAVVMDPRTGEVRAMASFPTYDPAILADGITTAEFGRLGMSTPSDNADDALLNRPIQAALPPGSTFKVVTAGAALSSGIADIYDRIPCPGARTFGSISFSNWTNADFGSIGFPESLEVSCDTFYYDLGWRLEDAFGAANGDGSERFQDYMRKAGFGKPTGIDIPSETGGRVPDEKWCLAYQRATGGEGCAFGWLPGYSVNMSIGQGDLIVTPLQMATTYAALVNGGRMVEPRVGVGLGKPRPGGKEQITRRFKTKVVNRLPLSALERSVLKRGLEDVVMGDRGTARGAFAGFPLERFPVAGKTGTAQIGALDSGLNFAWFTSYAPADDPRYVIVVYLERAGHGGESAAPIARQIYEGIFRIDGRIDMRLGRDRSG